MCLRNNHKYTESTKVMQGDVVRDAGYVYYTCIIFKYEENIRWAVRHRRTQIRLSTRRNEVRCQCDIGLFEKYIIIYWNIFHNLL